jgi:hypothetical protein
MGLFEKQAKKRDKDIKIKKTRRYHPLAAATYH